MGMQEVGAAISSSLGAGDVVKEQACFLPLSPDGTPVIGPVLGAAGSLYVASGMLLLEPAASHLSFTGAARHYALSIRFPHEISTSDQYLLLNLVILQLQ